MKNDSLHPPSEDLFAFRDGELSPEKRAIIEAHVMGCSVCRSFIDQVSSLEAELRQAPDRAPVGYLESLQEKVRARIAVAASEAVGEGAPLGGAPEGRERRRGAVGLRERRRRDDAGSRRERGRIKEAPVLPWAAVISTASAAAAVLVVVAILIKQGPYQRMIAPRVSKAVAPSAGGRVERERSATGEAGTPAGAAGNEAGAGGAPGKKPAADALGKDAGVAAPDESVEKAEGGAVPPAAKLDGATRGRLEGTAKMALKPETAPTEQTPAREESSEFHGELQQKPQASAAPRALAKEPQALAPGYAAILSRYGLPPLWDGARVSPEALANAEPELRSLYVSGAAGNDSARVRLYVAEAVRLRYAPGDSTLYDEILRHYRRAIDLAGPDVETARVAEERLRTLER